MIPGSEAATIFSFICSRMSEIDSPALSATSTTDWPRWSDDITELSAWDSERWFWAMAQMAGLSLALATSGRC